jgi:two-component system, OmpR family, sensor histidine kinase QseC
MIAWLQPLWRPTLLRRLLGTLLLAFALVGAALSTQTLLEFKQSMAEKPGVQSLADAIAASLADIQEPRDAALIMGSHARELNQMRREANVQAGDVELKLTDASGRSAFATPGAAQVSHDKHWMAQAQGGRWRLMVAEPRLPDTTVMGWIWKDLIVSLALAFPLVLLPLWIAVQRGMKPLTELAERVAQLGAQDLSPLGITPPYDELRPLARAFDDLLARLRAQLQRERAFVQDAAHELRTPMAVVAAQAHLLSTASGEAERRQAAESLDAALRRASHLSRQLLALATLDETRAGAAQSLDLADLVEQALAQLAPQALERGLDLSLDAPPSLPARVDRAAFESVLLNLVDNALRYVPAGGRVAVSLSADGSTAQLRVADDGPGIPADQREAAFERFWRGASSGDIAGSGLGLAIVRRAVLRLGGQVHIEDGLNGRGCSFVATLPCAQPLSTA